MKTFTQKYLIGLLTASMLVGCGSSGENESNEGTENTQQEQQENNNNTDDNQPVEENNGTGGGTPASPPPTATDKTFTSDVMAVLESKCKSCHGDNGNFTITTPSATYANISDLKNSITMAGQYLLDKGSNTTGHGGGEVISTTSTEYATIKSWVDAGADFN